MVVPLRNLVKWLAESRSCDAVEKEIRSMSKLGMMGKPLQRQRFHRPNEFDSK